MRAGSVSFHQPSLPSKNDREPDWHTSGLSDLLTEENIDFLDMYAFNEDVDSILLQFTNSEIDTDVFTARKLLKKVRF